jgi:hypothetical protein
VDGGDFIGFSVQADVTPVKGPALATWLSDHSKTKAEGMPPLWTISLRYTFDYLEQSIWASNSDIWDWDREKIWAPGYKNILSAKMQFSFLRLGVPLQVYAVYRTLGLIPGKNTRAAEVVSAGIQVPLKFW